MWAFILNSEGKLVSVYWSVGMPPVDVFCSGEKTPNLGGGGEMMDIWVKGNKELAGILAVI